MYAWVLAGMLVTGGLGERNPGYYVGLEAESLRHFSSEVTFDSSNKYTGAGWVLRGAHDTHVAGPVWAGLSGVVRDARTFQKQRLGLRAQVQFRNHGELTYEREALQRSKDNGGSWQPMSNEVQMVEWRSVLVWPHHRTEFDERVAAYHHSTGWGVRTQLGIRFGGHVK